jgi:hypothetical protein
VNHSREQARGGAAVVWYIDLEAKVDNDFDRARQKAILRRMKACLQRHPVSDRLLSFEEVRKNFGALNRIYLGTEVVRVEKIVGSVGRFRDFDQVFLPRGRV